MANAHTHENAPMFTDQEKGLLVVVLVWLAMAFSVFGFVFSTLPDKHWGEYANAGPIVPGGAAQRVSH
jgi:hypothetical protein